MRYSAQLWVPVISGDTEGVDNLGIRLPDSTFGVLDACGDASLDVGLAHMATVHLAPDSDATDGHPKRGVGFACLLPLGVVWSNSRRASLDAFSVQLQLA